MTKRIWMLVLLLTAVDARMSVAQPESAGDGGEEERPDESDRTKRRLNLPTPTLGGWQFWTDEMIHRQWRIQRNVVTGHFRLIGPGNVRHAWGTREACAAKFAELRREREIPPIEGKVVVVVHGLGRTCNSMTGVARYLEKEGGFTVLNFGYASSREDIGQHAKSLASVMDQLDDGVTEINFVAHSLGNLVIRHWLADQTNAELARKPDPRIKRIVMYGPPNQGAQLARRLGRLRAFHWVIRGTGKQLAADEAELRKILAVPACQFGIIAGGKGVASGVNPLIRGDDDLIVSVEETKLPGAHDFVVLPVLHTWMMNDERVREYTLRFLQEGCFVSQEKRTPLQEKD